LLGELSRGDPQRLVICDLEAGINTLFRARQGFLDRVLAVCEPTIKSIEVTERVLAMADRLGFEAWVLANRLIEDSDATLIHERFPDRTVYDIPEDPSIAAADRAGLAPFDFAPDSPGVRAIVSLAGSIIR